MRINSICLDFAFRGEMGAWFCVDHDTIDFKLPVGFSVSRGVMRSL